MKDGKLQIDRSCHVLYSKPCKKEILAKITLHYTEMCIRDSLTFFRRMDGLERIFTIFGIVSGSDI